MQLGERFTGSEEWSLEQVQRLLAAAARLTGLMRRTTVKRSDYWVALILTSYDTALRRGDLLQLKRSQIDGEGRFVVVQDKTL